MTVSSTNRKAGPYYGNGVTTAFPFSFKVFAASDLLVVKTNLTTGIDTVLAATDYSVSLTADTTGGYSGGTVTLTTGALASTYTLTITSSILYTQNTDLTNNGGFYPKVINSALDRLTILCQQLLEQASRSLKLSISTPPGVTPTLPTPVKNNMIAWNANGDGLQNLDPQALATIVAFGTSKADVFSGDGTTTQFALSNNPGALNNLDVSIGGVTQRPGIDYTWSAGTVITFTTAPTTGTNNILVRYMQGLPQGYTTSDMVQYGSSNVKDALDAINLTDYAALQAYTGNAKSVHITGYLVSITPSGIAGPFTRDDADTTTPSNGGTVIVDGLGRRWKRSYSGNIDVKWFGAQGDWNGITGADDTVAIQNALNAGLTIQFGEPDKNYKVTAAINLRTGHTITGKFAKITQTTNNTEIFNYEGKTDIDVSGIHFVGVGTDYVESDSSRAVAMFGNAGEARIKVHNNRFTNFGYTTLRAKNATDIEFCNNVVIGPGAPILTPITSGRNYGMLADSGCYRVLCSDNTISKVAQGFRIEGCQDVRITDNIIHSIVGQHGVYAGAALTNIVIADNNIGPVDLIGVKVQAQNGYSENKNITISNNTITSTGDQGILLCNGAGATSQTVKVKTATIVGNTLKAIGGSAINIQNTVGCVVADNVADTISGSGVNLSACDYVSVKDNIILSVQYSGIRDQESCTDVVIDNNRLHNVAQAAAGSDAYGIYFGAATSSNITISNNDISDANVKMLYGIFTPGGDQTTFSVFENTIRNATGHSVRYKNGTDAMRVCRDNVLLVPAYNDTALPTVASASSISLPSVANVVRISGTTTINTITPSGQVGKIVTLVFVDGCTVVRGSNILISSNFTATPNDTLTIITDGNLWYEVARAIN